MVFASLIVVGLSTLIQVRRLGPIGSGSVLPMFTAAFAIPFCITAVTDGGPATLTALLLVCGGLQLVISKWLFILRRLITPTVGGTVMMILSITLASVVFGLLDDASIDEPVAAPLTALGTLVIVGALTFRGTALLRLWAPMIGIVLGSGIAAAFGLFEVNRVTQAAWVGIPSEWPGLGVEFGVTFWALLPAFLFLGIIISIQANGESIAIQRVSRRESRAIDFREVQGTLAGAGASNLLAGIGGRANMVHAGAVSFTQVTGIASRRVGYIIGLMFIAVAFLPKVSGLLSSIPGPVMTGYLILVTGTLFVEGARTVIMTEQNRQKVLVAASLLDWRRLSVRPHLPPSAGRRVGNAAQERHHDGGFAAILMILFLEFTSHRSMRFQSDCTSTPSPT